MSTIQELFQQAQLAEAAYADLWDSSTDSVITDDVLVGNALQDEDNDMEFSSAQAADFVSDWKVVDHIPDTTSGFSRIRSYPGTQYLYPKRHASLQQW